MTFIIYYQYNYNYYQYKQTEIKLEFYLFREYLPETILNHHLDRFCIFRRLCTEKMTCAITRFLSLYHIDIILILIVKSLHSTFQHSILVPVYRIRPVPIPDIGYHIVFLAFKLSRLVKPKLIVRRTPCCLVTPFHIITFHLYHQITVWCSATIHVSCPPCAAGRSDIMFVNGRGGQLIFIKVRVSGENMYLVRPQQLEKRIGVARISPPQLPCY